MNIYEIRQAEKADRYRELAKRHASSGESTLKQVRAERGMIPLGQPILIGHHSEKRHRNHLDSMNRRESRGWEHLDKSDHYDRKVANIENPYAISSDDPDAVSKLKEKLAGMEVEREKFKAYNKEKKAAGEDILPRYVLTNLGANIRRVKKRIDTLIVASRMIDKEYEIGGVTIKEDTEDNRIRLFFPEKPAEDFRRYMKSHGFRFSGRNVCWQRMLNGSGIFNAAQVATSYGEQE